MKILLALALFLSLSFAHAHAHPAFAQTRAFQVGDSITVGCTHELNAQDIQTNGFVGRQFYQGIIVLEGMYRHTPPVVIVELGTNGFPMVQNIYSIMGALKQSKKVFFVTVQEPRIWQDKTNSLFRWATKHWKKVHLIQWHGESRNHPSWFSSDGIHPNVTGCHKLASLENRTLKYYGV